MWSSRRYVKNIQEIHDFKVLSTTKFKEFQISFILDKNMYSLIMMDFWGKYRIVVKKENCFLRFYAKNVLKF